jgi:predicted DNA-binding transcriptional regulator YafY
VAKLDRLLNLTAALLEARVPMTADEIRARVPGYSADSDEAFHRAFERDKDDLRELGVPIETVTVAHHEQPRAAYTIERDRYELPDPGFELDELAAIQLAATAVQLEGLDRDDVEEGLRKLGGSALPDGNAGAPLGAVPTPESLLELFVAVLERREVDFGYGGARRRVQPHRLQFERGRWYLTGHDLDRDAHRSFRLDRIGAPVTTGERDAFAPPEQVPGVRLRPWELGDAPERRAQVLLDAEIARSVLNEDPGLTVAERHEDGSVVVELVVRSPVALRNFVLSLLDRAELLGPEDLRDDLIDWLEQLSQVTTERSA